MNFNEKLLDILIYIGTHIDKNILIRCIKNQEINIQKTNIQEIHGDLFTSSDINSSLAHCVAKDLGTGKGIAKFFKKNYGGGMN
jgi:hypothetical protein